MPDWFPIPGWLDVVDIALVAGFIWLAIRYFRRTHASAAAAGLALLGIVYFFARGLELRLTETLLQGFFAVLVLVLVVVFQEDLRRAFEQLGSWRGGRTQVPAENETLDLLVRTAVHLASTRTGALIVLPMREPLDRHVEGGIKLGGRVSEPLLLSIFESSTPGHDGAVILRGPNVERFAVHLPLSADHAALGPGGTRHAAALGLAERCDAICIVVSEERGTVSVARDGGITTLRRPEDLIVELRSVFERKPEERAWWRGRIAADAAMATVGAVALWMVVVPGSVVSEITVSATVEVANLPADMRLESVDPSAIEVTLRGLRRDLLLAERNRVSVQIDGYLAKFGRRTFAISDEDVRTPDGLSIVTFAPDKLKLSIETSSTTGSKE